MAVARMFLAVTLAGAASAALRELSRIDTGSPISHIGNNENHLPVTTNMLFASNAAGLSVVNAEVTGSISTLAALPRPQQRQAHGRGIWFFSCEGGAGFAVIWANTLAEMTRVPPTPPVPPCSVILTIQGSALLYLGGADTAVSFDTSNVGAPSLLHSYSSPGKTVVEMARDPVSTNIYVLLRDAGGMGWVAPLSSTLAPLFPESATNLILPTDIEIIAGTIIIMHKSGAISVNLPGSPTDFLSPVGSPATPFLKMKVMERENLPANKLLIAVEGVGAQVWDVSNPIAPVPVELYAAPGIRGVGRTAEMEKQNLLGSLYFAIADGNDVVVLTDAPPPPCSPVSPSLAPVVVSGPFPMALPNLNLVSVPPQIVGLPAYNPVVPTGQSITLSCCGPQCTFAVALLRCTTCMGEANDFKTQLIAEGATRRPCGPVFNALGEHPMDIYYLTMTSDVTLTSVTGPTNYVVAFKLSAPLGGAPPTCPTAAFAGPSAPCACPP